MADKKQEEKTATEAADTGPEIVGKISASKIVGDVVALLKAAEGKAVILMRTIGIASGYKTGRGTYGDWTCFTGSFECERVSDGKLFVGSKLFLPPSVTEMIYTALQANIDKETGEMGSVQFAFEIGIKPAKNPIGYEYTVRSLVKAEGADPLAALRSQVKQAALPAPK